MTDAMPDHLKSNDIKHPRLAAGYLPGSDKATTTQASSTLAAVEAACEVLRPGGLLSILCYTGHPGRPSSRGVACSLLLAATAGPA